MSSSICGCVGEGFFTPMGYYEESHIIYSKITNISNNKVGNIFLDALLLHIH